MMRIPLKVTYSDGREQSVIVSAPDLIAFERHFDKPTAEIASGRVEYLWWSTWHAAKRAGHTSLEFDAWLETIDDISDDTSVATEVVPLASSQPTG